MTLFLLKAKGYFVLNMGLTREHAHPWRQFANRFRNDSSTLRSRVGSVKKEYTQVEISPSRLTGEALPRQEPSHKSRIKITSLEIGAGH